MDHVQVFVDETGIENLLTDIDGSSTHYVVTAVMVQPGNTLAVLDALHEVSRKYFGGGEIKSSSVGDDDPRRMRVLDRLAGIDFRFYALVCDKEELGSRDWPGYRFRRSFRKNIHGKLYGFLYRAFPDLHIVAHQYGRKEFEESFREYVKKYHKCPLYAQEDVEFVPGSNRFVQLADFVGGTISRCFDRKLLSTQAADFLSVLKPKEMLIDQWPPCSYTLCPGAPAASAYDAIVGRQAVDAAREFLLKNESRQERDDVNRVMCVRLLLGDYMFFTPDRFVSGAELVERLAELGCGDITIDYLRASIIAGLRDSDVLIASSNAGYKIPTCVADVIEFVNRINVNVVPMLRRVDRCRKRIRLATAGKLDILESPEYRCLVLPDDGGPP